ncbi:hypothetical protein JOL62DRAFT_293216 [Phyllosticta paracitricarpa]|uniref:Uncharacterized protein n=1 Tax=Phyllosticta paracitricarpa TaxID=2016321 RepID=A0ABR1NH77_9PEZI
MHVTHAIDVILVVYQLLTHFCNCSLHLFPISRSSASSINVFVFFFFFFFFFFVVVTVWHSFFFKTNHLLCLLVCLFVS